MNPRSVYDKNQEEVDILFMSESWERENLSLDQIIKLEKLLQM